MIKIRLYSLTLNITNDVFREKRGIDIINPDTGKSIFADSKKESTPPSLPEPVVSQPEVNQY